MRLLDGKNLADFIKVRQNKSVRFVKQSAKITPQLAIITTTDNPVNEIYIKLKKMYAEDIGIIADIYRVQQADIPNLIKRLNQPEIHGIIIQLPLEYPKETEEICQLIPKDKDIDGLNPDNNLYTSATATAITWLLAGYNIELKNKKIVILGSGKLVGKPLLELWQKVQLEVISMNEYNLDWQDIKQANILITATGQAKLVQSHHLANKAVVIDTGAQYIDGQLVGDVDPEVYRTRDDLTITPLRGGIGPLTICVLFENLLATILNSIK